MDLTSIDSAQALSNARLGSEISTRVAKKALDIAKDQGEAAVRLIRSAASAGGGQGGGQGVGGVGGRLDVQA